uniref:Uncharacterized protein TCIL3000_5_730 n=1 Tax=Trypanosoma congolense (strain IL3000) TaxID=1068625 RepID=G0UMH3_TRYCI|nr:unnamed protein product [Trypanosoma congolense IL3000]
MNEEKVTSTDGDYASEPPAKIRRLESTHDELRSNPVDADVKLPRDTLFIRCAAIHGRGELLNGFMSAHRKVLGVEKWYEYGDGTEADSAATLRSDAPFECVYVKWSRKPYFLLELSEEENTVRHFVEGLTGLNNTTYKGSLIHVEVAKPGVTVAVERSKMEKRDAARRAAVVSTSMASSKPITATVFVPRVLQKK